MSPSANAFYGYALAVAKVYKKSIFMTNVRRDMTEFGVSAGTILDWTSELESEEWFVPQGKKEHDPDSGRTHSTHYLVLDHDEWTDAHGTEYCRYYLGKDEVTKEPRWKINPQGTPRQNAISVEIRTMQAKSVASAAKRKRCEHGRFSKSGSSCGCPKSESPVPQHGTGVFHNMEQAHSTVWNGCVPQHGTKRVSETVSKESCIESAECESASATIPALLDNSGQAVNPLGSVPNTNPLGSIRRVCIELCSA